jgi:hypothetical protein
MYTPEDELRQPRLRKVYYSVEALQLLDAEGVQAYLKDLIIKSAPVREWAVEAAASECCMLVDEAINQDTNVNVTKEEYDVATYIEPRQVPAAPVEETLVEGA